MRFYLFFLFLSPRFLIRIPFPPTSAAISFPFSHDETQGLLEHYAKHIQTRVAAENGRFERILPSLPSALNRIHIVYMSSDFARHTTGTNIAGVGRKREKWGDSS